MGWKANIVEDHVLSSTCEVEIDLKATYVVFDIETTGLSAIYNNDSGCGF